jgi:hypothetical protein
MRSQKVRMASAGVAAAAHGRDGGQTRVIPAADAALGHQPAQLALAHHRVGQVQPGELDLPRAVDAQGVQEPLVQGPVVFKLQGADGVGDGFNGVALAVGPVVGGVDAPGVACAGMLGVQDTVHDGVAQVDVGRAHVDLGPQHSRPVGKVALAHTPKEVEVLFDGAVAVGAVLARFGQRAAVLADLDGAEVVHVGLALLDELDGPAVELLEVVGGEEEPVFPVGAEPAHILDDGVDILLLLFEGVGVVKAQVELATVILGDAVI